MPYSFLSWHFCPIFLSLFEVTIEPFDYFQPMRSFQLSHQGAEESRFSTYHIYSNDGVPYSQLEHLVYHLCYTCARGARSVSCPAPLYYARLACRRALSLT